MCTLRDFIKLLRPVPVQSVIELFETNIHFSVDNILPFRRRKVGLLPEKFVSNVYLFFLSVRVFFSDVVDMIRREMQKDRSSAAGAAAKEAAATEGRSGGNASRGKRGRRQLQRQRRQTTIQICLSPKKHPLSENQWPTRLGRGAVLELNGPIKRPITVLFYAKLLDTTVWWPAIKLNTWKYICTTLFTVYLNNLVNSSLLFTTTVLLLRRLENTSLTIFIYIWVIINIAILGEKLVNLVSVNIYVTKCNRQNWIWASRWH